MQFKQPDVLYALLLLLIPLFIHLFQLRKFQKVAFTNVAFLKKVDLQTRQSSRLKKWLTLLLRMLALACIVLAFAQPFSASDTASSPKELVVYVDNSFSMQLSGSSGPMLKNAQQQLFELPLPEGTFSWFSNDASFSGVDKNSFRQEVLRLGYTHQQMDMGTVLLKARDLFSRDPSTLKRLVIVSDLQGRTAFPEDTAGLSIALVRTNPVTRTNISLDSAAIVSRDTDNARLQVWLSRSGDGPLNAPVSLYRNDKLLARVAVSFEGPGKSWTIFDLDQPDGFNGVVKIEDNNLLYDNSLHININPLPTISVMSIDQAPSVYLSRLFTQEEFAYTPQNFQSVNYSELARQNLVVLNQLEDIPNSLVTALRSLMENGGSVVVIPPAEADLSVYNPLLTNLGLGSLVKYIRGERNITRIAFEHPLYQGVFEREVVNFQYPQVKGFYRVRSGGTTALAYEDGSPFLLQQGQAYLFTAPLETSLGNFTSSPLIVPTLFNMGLQSLPGTAPYFLVSRENRFAVPYTPGRDEILKITGNGEELIPRQASRPNGTLITTTELPATAGNYRIVYQDTVLQRVSYNYPRDESVLNYSPAPEEGAQLSIFGSVGELNDFILQQDSFRYYWKWFVILAIVFLLLEMLVLKYLKN